MIVELDLSAPPRAYGSRGGDSCGASLTSPISRLPPSDCRGRSARFQGPELAPAPGAGTRAWINGADLCVPAPRLWVQSRLPCSELSSTGLRRQPRTYFGARRAGALKSQHHWSSRRPVMWSPE